MTDSTSTNSFVSQLTADTATYSNEEEQAKYRSQNREDATEHFLAQYFTSPDAQSHFETTVLHKNKLGQRIVRLTGWSGRGPSHLDQFLTDLLDTGDLLQRMQDHLNLTYGEGQFRVFNHRVSGKRMTALSVSWDSTGFENIDQIIATNRTKAIERRERAAERAAERDDDRRQYDDRRPHDDRRQYDDRRGPGPDRRGGYRRQYDDDRRPPRRDRRQYDDDRRGGYRRQYDDDRRGPRSDRRQYDDDRRPPRRDEQRNEGTQRPSRRRAALDSVLEASE